ncbi:hypothetical protein R83H12_00082 [Fibrobacteria bacterium R8-3-H12]
MDKKIPTPLPIGKSIFDKVIEGGCYYVDKTLLIKDILDSGTEVILCTRPRRFGKTLNQTMLKCFFEDTKEIGGKDTRVLFKGLKIENAGAEYLEHQGKYPVIFLSFKDVERDIFEHTLTEFKKLIANEFKRHNYVVEKINNENDRELFKKISACEGSDSDYSDSIKFLSGCLENYHGKKTVILIDEYDVPLNRSHICGFYKELIAFVRPLLSSAFKDNAHLQLSVITGCLRISKESIFTGLNNLKIVSIISKNYAEYFGFTQNEIDALLAHYGLEGKAQEVRDWYDGYMFGNTEVYNPWSSINVVDGWLTYADEYPKPYWVNTSGNDIVRKLISEADGETRAELEILMSGGTISKEVHEDVTYDEIDKNIDNLWNFLFFTGYLKKVGERKEGVKIFLDLSIPNLELQYIYEVKISEWFKEQIKQKDFRSFYSAILNGNAEMVQKELGDLLLETISYFDSQESFYHGFMLGILAGQPNFSVKSNREAGKGRSDIIMRHLSKRGQAVIFELKWTDNIKEIATKADEALRQIDENLYCKELEDEGYESKNILKYGIAFCKKDCEVKI